MEKPNTDAPYLKGFQDSLSLISHLVRSRNIRLGAKWGIHHDKVKYGLLKTSLVTFILDLTKQK